MKHAHILKIVVYCMPLLFIWASVIGFVSEAWADARKPSAQNPAYRARPALPFDEAQAWNSVRDETRSLRDLAANGGSPGIQQKLAQLTMRAARGAERVLANGDEQRAADYFTLINTELADTVAALETLSARRIASADFTLGTLALHGILLERDLARACRYFTAALDNGFIAARFRAGQCIEGTDPPRAYRLLQAAAADGHLAATERLGRICLEAQPPELKCALQHIETAANGGRTRATALLGWLYAEGMPGRIDLPKAAAYYRTAAQKGDLPAANNLAEMLERGRGVRTDHAAAFRLYLRAAEQGYAPAQFNIARMYIAGRGTKPDLESAHQWLKKAALGGIEEAKELLDALESEDPAKVGAPAQGH